jgi:hypothetical protein
MTPPNQANPEVRPTARPADQARRAEVVNESVARGGQYLGTA